MKIILALLVGLLVVLSVRNIGQYTYTLGTQDMRNKIINYCKADSVYLSEGLMMRCEVIESKRGPSV